MFSYRPRICFASYWVTDCIILPKIVYWNQTGSVNLLDMRVEDSRQWKHIEININEDTEWVIPVENVKLIIGSFIVNDNETSFVYDERRQ